MDADRNPMTPNTSPAPPSHHHYSSLRNSGDSSSSFQYDDFGMSSNNTTIALPRSNSDTNLSFSQSTQAYGPVSYHQQGHHQWQHRDYNNQQPHWPGYTPYQGHPSTHLPHHLMPAPSMSAPSPAPPPHTHTNQGVELTDLNNSTRAWATNNLSSQSSFDGRVLKSILESEAVKEAINNMCKAAVEAAIHDIKESIPEKKEEQSAMVRFVTVKPKGEPEFHWEVSEDTYDDLRRIKMDQTMVKAVLVQLHPVKKLRHMLLSGAGRKNTNSTQLPHRSVQIVTASMIKYLWRKGEEYVKNPDALILDHKEYCQTVRTLISKCLQWFKENFDEDGNRLPVTKKQKRRGNSSANEDTSARNASGESRKRSRRSNSTASNRNGHRDASQTLASSDDGLIDPNDQRNCSQEEPGRGTCNTNSSTGTITGLYGGYSGNAIAIAERPEPKAKLPPQKSVPTTSIQVPDGFLPRAPRRSKPEKEPKNPTKKTSRSTCNSRRSQPTSPKGTSAQSQGHSPMSTKNCAQSSRENIMQRPRSKGKENKASLRTPWLQSPTTKRPLSTPSGPEGSTPEASHFKAQLETHAHGSESQSQYPYYDLSQDMDEDLEPSDPLIIQCSLLQ